MDAPHKTPVLIVGGGPVGLSLAAELGWRGIACTLIEQGDGRIVMPKMNEVNTRTMEFCRRWGIADEVLNCPFPGDYPLDAAFVTSMTGYEIGRVARAPRNSQTPDPHSPYRLQACSQIWFDPMLQRLARSFATVELRYHHQLVSFTHSERGVTAEIVDLANGRPMTVAAQYLVGCDGVGSLVRRTLGIEMVGPGTIGTPLNMFFRTPDLLARCSREPATFFIMLDSEGLWANLRIIDPANGLWRLMVDDTKGEVSPETADRDGYLCRAIGHPLDVEWVDVNVWRRRSLVAPRYGEGRVWLAGDAVHQLSPTGALGMNSGVGDAVDLGWKLAAVLQGWGGGRLIDSYSDERQPVGVRNVGVATGFYRNNNAFAQWSAKFLEDSAEGEQARREIGEILERGVGNEFRTVGMQLGYRYENSPICIPDGTPPPPDEVATYVPSARPGSRAPHAWLPDGRSMLDLFGHGFVLLQLGGDKSDTSTFGRAAARRDVPLTTVTIDDPDVASLYECPLVLVRPDGHVAWRGTAIPPDPIAVIDTVRGDGA
jgi:2-polyprenyl-6-methoxyphenol hydroxylase-like FAD-dependent oxidoreductase